MKGEINKFTVIFGDFNTFSQLLIEEIENHEGLKRSENVINQSDLINIYRTLHPITVEYIFLPNVRGTFH